MKIKHCLAKRVLCFILCVSVLGACVIIDNSDMVSADTLINTETDIISLQNDRFSLTLNKLNDLLTVTDLSNGYVWESIVVDGLQDENAEGIAKTDLMSQLVVTYKSAMMTEMATNSYSDCVMNKLVEYSVSGNTITAVYEFKKLGFSIPVKFILTDNGFDAVVDAKNIKEGDNAILTVSLLPYFGAANSEDNGYMVVPDGSGAVIEFNNRKFNTKNYQKAFYGGDKSVVSKEMTAIEKNLMLPVFGVKKNDSAFVALISKGAACGRLNAFVSGHKNSYNNIYSTFIHRTSNAIEVKDNASSTKSVLFSAIDSSGIDEYCTEYCFLNGEDANYVGMAKFTGKYLEKYGVSEKAKGKPYLNLQFYGASQKPASFLGFRYTKTQKLTTFADVGNIVAKTNKYCDNIHIVLKNFSKNEIEKKPMTKYSFITALGGKKGFEKLVGNFDDKNVQISSAYDFMTFEKSGNGYNKFKNISMGLDLSTSKLHPYKINTASIDETNKPTYLIVSDKYSSAAKEISKSIKKNDFKYAYFESAGNTLYSDFSKDGSQVNKASQNVAKALDSICKNAGVVLSTPNMYAMPYASSVSDIPCVSSSWQIFDYDIPFYQIAIRGLLDYSGEVLNFGGYTVRELLKNIECGANLSYAVTACNAKELLYTDDEDLYATSYESVESNIKEWYKKSSEVIGLVSNSRIIDHKYENNIALTVYENGVRVYVNYGLADTTIDGLNIPSEDFVIKEG